MKNVLITGGAGFIGSNLALKLIAKGCEVTVLDTLSPQIHGADPETTSPLFKSISGKVKFIHGSVTSETDLRKALDGQHYIVHYAAETGTGQSMYQIESYVDTNSRGTALMLDILANSPHAVRKVVVASSRSVYGEGRYQSEEMGFVYPSGRSNERMKNGHFEVEHPGCTSPLKLVATNEDSKLHPSSVYGITKLNQEQLVMTVCPAIGIAGVALRYQNVYGPGQSLSNPYTGVLSIFSGLIRNKQPINIFEDGKESRDFVYIDDVVDATILALESERADNEVFNVGAGEPVTILEVVEELTKNFNMYTGVSVTGNYRLGDIRHNFADLTKIANLLGFRPKVSFAEGIRRFTAWVNSQEITASGYEKSLAEMKEKGLFK